MFSRLSRRHRPFWGSLVLAGLIGGMTLPSTLHAAPVMDKPSFPTLIYWDNWTDTQGISHLTKCRITSFRPFGSHSASEKTAKSSENKNAPQAMVWTGANRTGVATVTTTIQPQGWKSDWRATDHVEWIVPVAGVYTTQTMDGTRIELNPGDILLSEDMGSIRDKEGHQGHLSSNNGKDAVALVVTRFDAAPHPTHKACAQQ